MDTIPAELSTLPYQLFPLQHADRDRAETTEPEYVTGYLVLPDDEAFVSRWLEIQLARFRAALPAGWSASWIATDPGDTRIVVRRSAVTIAQPDLTSGRLWVAEEMAGMPDADRRVAELVSALPEIEPLPGYEERAVERAKREGVL